MSNKIVWLVVGLLVLGMGAFVVRRVFYPPSMKPTPATAGKDFMEIIQPAMSLGEVLGTEPSTGGNAGDDYARAAKILRENRNKFVAMWNKQYENDSALLDSGDMALAEQALAALAPAMEKKEMRYIGVHTPTTFKVSRYPDSFADFIETTNSSGEMSGLGISYLLDLLFTQYQRANEPAQAKKIAMYQMILGWQMMNERVRGQVTLDGVMIIKSACEKLIAVAGDTAGDKKQAEAARNYRSQVSLAQTEIEAKMRILWTLKRRADGVNAPEPGDVFKIIHEDKDRQWKVEGLLTLGILRVTDKGHYGNRTEIESLLAEYKNSGDPFLKAAAIAAENSTREQIEGGMSGNTEE